MSLSNTNSSGRKLFSTVLFAKQSALVWMCLLFFIPCQSLYATSDTPIQVIDAGSGETLIGVNIYTPDYSFSTTTDLEGKALLSNLDYRDEIIFSYIGYELQTLSIADIRRKNGIVALSQNATADTIVVIGRRDDPIDEIPYQVDRIKQSDITFSNAQTSADALGLNGDAFIQKTQLGGGSPIIRGFEANRVLLVVDGVRLNNAIYRNGHLQSAITVDNAMLEQMEIIYGPGSLIYGSDALGGVVHFRSKDPQLLYGDANKNIDHVINGNYSVRFGSANFEKRMHVDLAYSSKKWGFLISGTAVDYDALRGGGNRPSAYPDFGKRRFYVNRVEGTDQIYNNSNDNVQIAVGNGSNTYRFWITGYSQLDGALKIKYQPNEDIYFILNSQISSSTNIPRYDNLTDTINIASKLKFSEWYYGPQFRSLISLKTRVLKPNNLYDKAMLIGAFQAISEDRISRKLLNLTQTVNDEDVYVYSLTADFDKYVDERERHLLSYGLDLSHNSVYSTALERDIETERIILGENTRYPSGGSQMITQGAYINYRWRSRDSSLTVNGGLRYSNVILRAKFLETDQVQWPTHFYNGVRNQNDDLTWAFGVTWKNSKGWQIRGSIAKAFRSPNIDDFAKIRVKGNKVTVPNIDLQPERSFNGELTIAKAFGEQSAKKWTLKLSATAFYSYLTDAIVRVDSSTLEDEFLVVDEEFHNIQTNINTRAANIYGVSANVHASFRDFLFFKSSINYTKGTTSFSNAIVQDTIVPFAHIPPIYGATSVTGLFLDKRLKIELAARYNGAKRIEDYSISDVEANGQIDREGTPDNFEFTPTIKTTEGDRVHVGAYAWTTLNLSSSYQFSKKLSMNLAVENIMDFHYRSFGSNLSAPGINLVVGLQGKF